MGYLARECAELQERLGAMRHIPGEELAQPSVQRQRKQIEGAASRHAFESACARSCLLGDGKSVSGLTQRRQVFDEIGQFLDAHGLLQTRRHHG